MKSAALILVWFLSGCASLESMDRSLVASPLLSFQEGNLDKVAPHTGLRGGAIGSGGCSVCAH